MAGASDIKFYESLKGLDSLGGDITSTQIISGTTNNLFDTITKSDMDAAPKTYYKCMYIKNTSAETIKNVSFWMTSGTTSDFTGVNWAFEPTPHKYTYHPFHEFNGSSDFVEQADSTALDLNQFSLQAWFKTSTNYASAAYIISKGVEGSEAGADNFNYRLTMNSSEQIEGGFEEAGGTDHFATSPLSYNDGKWHVAHVTYDSITVRLYIDGIEVATHATATTPNTNARNLRIGSDSVGTAGTFFNGQIDDVRVWSDDLTAGEITSYYNDTTVPQTDNIVYKNKFGSNNNSWIAQEIADINTEPAGVVWKSVGNQPTDPNIGILGPGGYRPIWIKWFINPGVHDVVNDRAIFNFTFDITTGGTAPPPTPTDPGGNPQPTPTDYRIAVVGDWGEENETDDVVNYIKDHDYDLVIGTGDNSYTSSDASWYSGVIKPIDDNQGSSIQFESCIGNHDSESSIKSHFGYDHGYDSFDFQNIHVLILDTESDMSVGSAQHDFAINDLTAQDNRSNIDWIFAVWHRPAIGPSSDHTNNEESQVENYFDLFLQHGVNMVFQGHNHIWFRSYPVKRSGSSATAIDKSAGPYTVGDPNKWLIALISGTGGHDTGNSLYSLNNTPSYSAYQNNTNNGIVSIEASNTAQTLTCKFINTGNSIKHTFVINHD